LGKKKCFGRDIETKVVVQGMFASEGQGNGACTRADIDDEARGKIFKKLGGVLYEKFGFGARNQSGRGTLKSQARKTCRTRDVLNRLAGSAAANERTKVF
jgi:hypothetical protein